MSDEDEEDGYSSSQREDDEDEDEDEDEDQDEDDVELHGSTPRRQGRRSERCALERVLRASALLTLACWRAGLSFPA
jgi:hypothetical protein